MNASTIVDPSMTLEEKLKAIDEAMKKYQQEQQAKYPGSAPLDPADLTQCEGCQ